MKKAEISMGDPLLTFDYTSAPRAIMEFKVGFQKENENVN